MSFFPSPDSERLRAANVHEQALYHIPVTPSPSQSPHSSNNDQSEDYNVVANTWYPNVSSSHAICNDPRTPSFPSEQLSGLGLSSLSSFQQAASALFDSVFSTGTSFDATNSWVPAMSSDIAVSTSSDQTLREPPVETCCPFPTPKIPSPCSGDPVQPKVASLAPQTTVSPSRSEYSTSSHESFYSSSSGVRFDGSSRAVHSPLVKIEEPSERGETRLYSVPDDTTFQPPSHVTLEDLRKRFDSCQHDSSGSLRTITQSTFDSDTKPNIRPQQLLLQQPRAQRAGPHDVSLAEARQKRTHTTQANSTCHCQQCGKLFQRSYNLKAHMDTHDPQREQPHACPWYGCTRRFVRRTDLIRHHESVSGACRGTFGISNGRVGTPQGAQTPMPFMPQCLCTKGYPQEVS